MSWYYGIIKESETLTDLSIREVFTSNDESKYYAVEDISELIGSSVYELRLKALKYKRSMLNLRRDIGECDIVKQNLRMANRILADIKLHITGKYKILIMDQIVFTEWISEIEDEIEEYTDESEI